MGHIGVAVIGAGQAGLSAAHWLGKRGIDHVLFDPSVPGDTWLSRWDSFHLVTPNWTVDLPGFPYTGDDPDGFMHRNEIADHVAAFAEQFRSLIRPARVERLKIGNSWTVDTTDGRWTADAVVVATGSHPVPKRPPVGEEIPSNVFQIHSSRYRSPDELPAGAVLVAGSGQSGAQIVDDLLLGGRRVWFAVGSAAAAPRRYRGRDMAAWFHDLGFMSRPMTPESRRAVSVMVSGRDGGKSLSLRDFGSRGVQLVGRPNGAVGRTLRFDDNVEDTIRASERVGADLMRAIDDHVTEHDLDAPEDAWQLPEWSPPGQIASVDLNEVDITSVVWATGFRYDFSWIDAPVTDEGGHPIQVRGVSPIPGLAFLGLHGMSTAGSGLLSGIGRDAEYVVDSLTAGH